jgi:hypothetical protein
MPLPELRDPAVYSRLTSTLHVFACASPLGFLDSLPGILIDVRTLH